MAHSKIIPVVLADPDNDAADQPLDRLMVFDAETGEPIPAHRIVAADRAIIDLSDPAYGLDLTGTEVRDDKLAELADICAGKYVYVPEGTIKTNGGLLMAEGAHFFGPGTIDMSSAPSGVELLALNGSSATPVRLAQNALKGTRTLQLISVAGLTRGDRIRLYSSDAFDPGRTGSPCGELPVIDSINTGTNTITTQEPLKDDYYAGDNSKISGTVTTSEGSRVLSGFGSLALRAGQMVKVANMATAARILAIIGTTAVMTIPATASASGVDITMAPAISTLSSNVSDMSLTIPGAVNTPANGGPYSTIGDAVVDGEEFHYTNIIGGDFIISSLADRGINGTTRTDHLAGASVYQKSNASVAKLTMRVGTTFNGLTFIGKPIEDGGAQIGIRMRQCVKPKFFDCTFKNIVNSAVSLTECVGAIFRECTWDGSNSPTTGYGVALGGCEDTNIILCDFTKVRHAMTVTTSRGYQSITRGTTFSTNKVSYTIGDAVDTHAGGEDTEIIFNRIIGAGSQGINIESADAIVRGNRIFWPADNGIGYHNETNRRGSFEANGNKILFPGGSGIKANPGSATGSGALWRACSISSNTIDFSAGVSIQVQGDALRPIPCVSVGGNVINRNQNTTAAILVQYAPNASVDGGSITDSTGVAVRVVSSDHATIRVPGIRFATNVNTTGVRIVTSNDVGVSGGNVDNGEIGVKFDNDCARGIVSGTNAGSCTHPFQFGTGSDHRHSGLTDEFAVDSSTTDITMKAWVSADITRLSGTLTADQVLNLSSDDVYQGYRLRIYRTGGGNFAWAVTDQDSGVVLRYLKQNDEVEVVWSGSGWGVEDVGSAGPGRYIRPTASPYAITNRDSRIGLRDIGANWTVNLQSLASVAYGQEILIKGEGGSENIRTITVVAAGSDTIEGVASRVIDAPYGFLRLYKGGDPTTPIWLVF